MDYDNSIIVRDHNHTDAANCGVNFAGFVISNIWYIVMQARYVSTLLF